MYAILRAEGIELWTRRKNIRSFHFECVLYIQIHTSCNISQIDTSWGDEGFAYLKIRMSPTNFPE